MPLAVDVQASRSPPIRRSRSRSRFALALAGKVTVLQPSPHDLSDPHNRLEFMAGLPDEIVEQFSRRQFNTASVPLSRPLSPHHRPLCSRDIWRTHCMIHKWRHSLRGSTNQPVLPPTHWQLPPDHRLSRGTSVEPGAVGVLEGGVRVRVRAGVLMPSVRIPYSGLLSDSSGLSRLFLKK